MKKIITVAAMAFLSISAVAQEKDRPNVILIYSDDQGYADLNIYGSKDLHTPNLDKLAKGGILFTQSYAAAPICSPSRAALMTGMYPQRAGLVGNAPGTYGHKGGLPTEQYTMAELFRDGGYRTAHIGKWHLGYAEEEMPNAQGFHYSFGFMGGVIDNYSHFYYWGGPNRHDLWENGKEIYRDGEYFPDLMVQYTAKFLEEDSTQPFFIYWAINIPHYPLQGENRWLDKYKDLPSPRDKYAAYVSTMDEKVGDLIQDLEKRGLMENTIIIFQSDHGFSREERSFGGGGSAGVYRGSKFSLFEGGIRVPTFISWKGRIPANSVKNGFVSNMDWFPTLAELCNIPLPERKLDGKSMVPMLNGKSDKGTHETFYWQSLGTQENPQWAVRHGKWKLLHRPFEAEKNELNESGYFLVNLEKDPSETTNLADSHPEIVDRLYKGYKTWIENVEQQ